MSDVVGSILDAVGRTESLRRWKIPKKRDAEAQSPTLLGDEAPQLPCVVERVTPPVPKPKPKPKPTTPTKQQQPKQRNERWHDRKRARDAAKGYGVYGQLAKEKQAATNLREMLLEERASHAAEKQSDQMLIADGEAAVHAAKDALRMSGKKLKRVAQQRDAHYHAAHGMFMAASAVVKEEAVAVKRLPVKKQLTRKQELAACSKKMRKLDAKRVYVQHGPGARMPPSDGIL